MAKESAELEQWHRIDGVLATYGHSPAAIVPLLVDAVMDGSLDAIDRLGELDGALADLADGPRLRAARMHAAAVTAVLLFAPALRDLLVLACGCAPEQVPERLWGKFVDMAELDAADTALANEIRSAYAGRDAGRPGTAFEMTVTDAIYSRAGLTNQLGIIMGTAVLSAVASTAIANSEFILESATSLVPSERT